MKLILLLLVRMAVVYAAHPGELDGPIAKGSTVSYAELLRLIFPDLKVDTADPTSAMATKAVAIRDLGDTAEPQATEDGSFKLERAVTVAGSKTRALLTFVMTKDGPERAFAVFDLGSKPKLVDVAGVPGFPDDVGSISRALRLNDSTDAYVFECHHFNSQQGYDGYTIFFVNGDRVEEIAAQGLLTCRDCASGSFDESVSLSTARDPIRVYNMIEIRVTFKQLADHRHRPSTRFYTAQYRWDAQTAKFVMLSQELQQLQAFNQKNY